MVQWCGLLVLVASAALARCSPTAAEPALRLAVPPAERLQEDADVLLGLPAGVDRDPMPPRFRSRAAAPKAPTLRVEADADPYRLPTAVLPTYYKLALSVNMTDWTFAGSVDISLNVLADTTTIVLHADAGLKFTQDSVTVEHLPAAGATADTITVTNLARSSTYQTVTITVDKPLQKNSHYTLHFASFSSDISKTLDGFYLSSYETKDGTTRYLATTQFESTSARKAFPCFDEPSFKARFDIQITHDKSYGVRSNMPESKSSPGPDDTSLTTVFQTTLPMSTYLLAWVVSDFEKQSNADKSFNTWARADIVKGGSMSQDVGVKALDELRKYTGIKFVLPKTDQFAIPDFDAGAMENWGLVTYREEYLIQTESTDVRYEQQIATVICHELSHQWTGNLVTLDWWSNTWLNEGFATFFENFICDKIKPEMKLIEKSVTSYARVAMVNDLIDNQHAMSSPVSTPDEISGKFDRISYSKGGTVLRMFQHVLTPAVFQRGLQRYLSATQLQNGTPDKLFRALSAEAVKANTKAPNTVPLPQGVTFTEVAKSWTEQPGVPVVTATCDFANKKCTLSQKQLRSPRSTMPSQNKWYIPITLVTSNSTGLSTKTVAWLTPATESVEVVIDVTDAADQWVVINPQQTGYYRVKYDDGSRNRVLAALKDSKNAAILDAATRAQLLSDVLGLADTEQLDWAQVVMFLETLKDSKDSAVWLAGYSVVSTLVNELANTVVYPSFKLIMNDITASTFSSIGLEVKNDDDHNTRHLRYFAAPYACDSGNAECLSQARDLLANLLNKQVPLHVDTARTVLCYGVKASDATVFGKVKEMWQATTGTTRSATASALACSSDQTLITGLLSELLAKAEVKPDDKTDLDALLRALITQQPDHHRFVFNFLKTNSEKIDKFFGESSRLSSLLASFIGTIRSDEEYQEVLKWASSTLASRAEYSKIQDSFSTVNAHLDVWFRKHYDSVSAYIYEQTHTSPPTNAPTKPTIPPTGPTNPPTGPTASPKPGPPSSTPKPKPSGASFARASAATMLALLLLVAALARTA